MVNYAFRPRRLSNYQNRQFMSGFADREHDMFTENPDAAISEWLRRLPGLSEAQRSNLISRRSDFWNAWTGADLLNPLQRPEEITQSFFDYLARLNPQREYYSSSPQSRGVERRRFTQPSRWVSF